MNDYLNPNGGYYKVKKEPKGPNNSKMLIAVAAIIIIGGIGIFTLKGNDNNDNNIPTISSSSQSTTSSNGSYSQNNSAGHSEQKTTEDISTTEAISSSLSIEPIADKELTIERIDVQKIQDSISQKDEKKTYELNTTEAGTYRIEFSDIPQNVQFTLYLYNSNMEQLAKEYDRTNGRGITAQLDANSLYYVTVEQEDNTGSYALNIGPQKATVDITGCTNVHYP